MTRPVELRACSRPLHVPLSVRLFACVGTDHVRHGMQPVLWGVVSKQAQALVHPVLGKSRVHMGRRPSRRDQEERLDTAVSPLVPRISGRGLGEDLLRLRKLRPHVVVEEQALARVAQQFRRTLVGSMLKCGTHVVHFPAHLGKRRILLRPCQQPKPPLNRGQVVLRVSATYVCRLIADGTEFAGRKLPQQLVHLVAIGSDSLDEATIDEQRKMTGAALGDILGGFYGKGTPKHREPAQGGSRFRSQHAP